MLLISYLSFLLNEKIKKKLFQILGNMLFYRFPRGLNYILSFIRADIDEKMFLWLMEETSFWKHINSIIMLWDILIQEMLNLFTDDSIVCAILAHKLVNYYLYKS